MRRAALLLKVIASQDNISQTGLSPILPGHPGITSIPDISGHQVVPRMPDTMDSFSLGPSVATNFNI